MKFNSTTFTKDNADTICSIIIDKQQLDLSSWNVLLGNFEEVIDFSDKTKFIDYINNSEKKIKNYTSFITNTELKSELENSIKKSLKYKVVEFGKSYSQELFAQMISYPFYCSFFYEKRSFGAYMLDSQQGCIENALGVFSSKKNNKIIKFGNFIYTCILGNEYSKWLKLYNNPNNIKNDYDLIIGCLLNQIPNGNNYWLGILPQIIKDGINKYSQENVKIENINNLIIVTINYDIDKCQIFKFNSDMNEILNSEEIINNLNPQKIFTNFKF